MGYAGRWFLSAIALFLLVAQAVEASECSRRDSQWAGAYYYKIVSLPGFSGLRTRVVLPSFTSDPDRWYSYEMSNPVHRALWWGPLDLADIYFGAHNPDGGHEMDAGLAWSNLYDASGKMFLIRAQQSTIWPASLEGEIYLLDETAQTLSTPYGQVLAQGAQSVDRVIRELGLGPQQAFTPFYRNPQGDPEWNPQRDRPFWPGETVDVTLTLDDGWFELTIGSVESSATPHVFKWRQTRFQSSRTGIQFKRVASIDQFTIVDGRRRVNEGMPGGPVRALKTRARLGQTQWLRTEIRDRATGAWEPLAPPECFLYRPIDLLSSFERIFRASSIDRAGGQRLEILPEAR